MARVVVMVATTKGTFLFESDERRHSWEMRGPFCNGWPMKHANYDPATGTLYAVGGGQWHGVAVWRSQDLGETWTRSSEGLTYGDSGPKLNTLWNITPAHGALYVGADPAGLFRSDDGGESFVHVAGLRNHPTCAQWQPGNGGLCLHTIVPHPTDPRQMWVAASAVGCFHTSDGGETWSVRTSGLKGDYRGEDLSEIGFCVHKVAMAPGNPNWLYQQGHYGAYRSRDGAATWEWINEGLPSTFGFPVGVHPRDPNTVYTIPLNGDGAGRFMPEGAAAVWRSRSGGDTWERLSRGLPQNGAFFGVLREAMALDTLPSAGIYFGTNHGQLFASNDEGESWMEVASYLPPISGVEVAVVS